MNFKHLYIFLIEKCIPKIGAQEKHMFDYIIYYCFNLCLKLLQDWKDT
jgi:hypothetical protein